jgi:hypothetical protein
MPWKPQDAARHNKQATGKSARQWADVANSVLERTGDDAQAVRTANGVLKKNRKKRKPSAAFYGEQQ